MTSKNISPKVLVGQHLAKKVPSSGAVIGIGTGSTVDAALSAIGERIRLEQLTISAITTSIVSSQKAFAEGITVLDNSYPNELVFGFDGADAVDSRRRVIKGKGGAMLREKLLAAKCKEYIIIIDDSKLTDNLATKCPVPIEVIPEALTLVERKLKNFNAKSWKIRTGTSLFGPTITELGNIILDVDFDDIPDTFERDLKAIPGVVETGLFLAYATEVLVAGVDGIRSF